MADQEVAVVVGGGPGLSASLVRLFTREGMKAAIAARNPDKLEALSESTGCRTYRCDAVVPEEVNELFARVSQDLGAPNVVVYNASARVRGPLTDLDAGPVRDAIMVTCYGGFLVGQAAAASMLRTGGGTILFTGASASVKGYANSASFAMGKFGLSGLTQSMAREFQPQNIHVAQIVIDGGIDSPRRDPGRGPDTWLSPDSIAETYLQLHRQHRSAWASHIELRPWVEKF
jgi:NAD(P)-dependent dehydrogenase (short-subunit alcohol dehydrogenase family)